MKTANGWVEPPKGKAKGAKTGAGKSPEKQVAKTESKPWNNYSLEEKRESFIKPIKNDKRLGERAKQDYINKYSKMSEEDLDRANKSRALVNIMNKYEETLEDAAPRVLTGDCKIRVRKV